MSRGVFQKNTLFYLIKRDFKSVYTILSFKINKQTKKKNYQASPQVYLNIAEVLEVSQKMANAKGEL